MPSAHNAIPVSRSLPNWAERSHPLGWLIEQLLAIGPLRQLLFWQARKLVIRTAESRGIPWRERCQSLQSQAEPLLAASTNPATAIPAYYRAPFHTYPQGNLCWQAACEAEQAATALAVRIWHQQDLSPADAEQRMRQAIFDLIEPSLNAPLRRVLDLGCSVGVGTQALKHWLDQRQAQPVQAAARLRRCAPNS